VTARWVVDEVQPARGLKITWQPISLFFKNEPEPGTDSYDYLYATHRLLRVMESVRASGGDVQPLYWEYGRRIHHDRQFEFTAADALAAVGLDVAHADAYDDDGWDDEIRTRMKKGIELAGQDIGTPILACDNESGEARAYFGPVITQVPPTEQSIKLWDALQTMMNVDGFWELKRTRTQSPEFGERP
jgi:hypothetical protein